MTPQACLQFRLTHYTVFIPWFSFLGEGLELKRFTTGVVVERQLGDRFRQRLLESCCQGNHDWLCECLLVEILNWTHKLPVTQTAIVDFCLNQMRAIFSFHSLNLFFLRSTILLSIVSYFDLIRKLLLLIKLRHPSVRIIKSDEITIVWTVIECNPINQ